MRSGRALGYCGRGASELALRDARGARRGPLAAIHGVARHEDVKAWVEIRPSALRRATRQQEVLWPIAVRVACLSSQGCAVPNGSRPVPG